MNVTKGGSTGVATAATHCAECKRVRFHLLVNESELSYCCRQVFTASAQLKQDPPLLPERHDIINAIVRELTPDTDKRTIGNFDAACQLSHFALNRSPTAATEHSLCLHDRWVATNSASDKCAC